MLVTGAPIDPLLQPFHEFECTGTNDQYVQDIDVTDEKREEFASATRTMLRLADGSLVSPYDDQFYREPTQEERSVVGMGSGFGGGISWNSKDWGDGKGYRAKVKFVPEGAKEEHVPPSDFLTWLTEWEGMKVLSIDNPLDLEGDHKYRYVRVVNGEVDKVINRTNPGKKWDWWVVGGRYRQRLLRKDGTRVDEALAGEVDWAGMRDEKRAEELAMHRRVYAVLGENRPRSWPAMYREAIEAAKATDTTFDRDTVLAAYKAQPGIAEIDAAGIFDFFDDRLGDILPQPDEAAYADAKAAIGGCTWGVLHAGEWIERGEMGWFGMSDATNDSIGAYAKRFREIVEALPADTPVAVVDCHI